MQPHDNETVLKQREAVEAILKHVPVPREDKRENSRWQSAEARKSDPRSVY